MNEQPYDYDQQGGSKINKIFILISIIAIGYATYMIVVIGINPSKNDDALGFGLGVLTVISGYFLIKHSRRNLNKIKKEKNWRNGI